MTIPYPAVLYGPIIGNIVADLYEQIHVSNVSHPNYHNFLYHGDRPQAKR